MLNHIQFIIHLYIGSSLETIKNIQNFSRPTCWSLRAFKPACLSASKCRPPSASAGFAKRKQFLTGEFPISPFGGGHPGCEVPHYVFSHYCPRTLACAKPSRTRVLAQALLYTYIYIYTHTVFFWSLWYQEDDFSQQSPTNRLPGIRKTSKKKKTIAVLAQARAQGTQT